MATSISTLFISINEVFYLFSSFQIC